MSDSALSDRSEPHAAVWAVLAAGFVAVATYQVAAVWWMGSGTQLIAVPALYAMTVTGAAIVAYLLHVRGRLLDQPGLLWLSAGFAVAGAAALLQAVTIVSEPNGEGVVATPTGAAGLYLIWHAALPLCVLGAMLLPERRRLRRLAVTAFVLLLLASMTDPGWLPLPRLVDGAGGFTLVYRLAVAGLLVLAVGVTVVWLVRIGRQATRTDSWVGVALVLLSLDMVVSVAAGAFFEAAWWSSVTLRTAQFVLPAAALMRDQGRLLHRLRNHEKSLADRFDEELELAVRARADPTPDPAVHDRIAHILDSAAFHPVFQPIYSLTGGDVVAVEALTRFDSDPYRTPDVWFAEATTVGLGNELELVTMRAALAAANDLPAEISLSLNASPSVLADRRFLELLDTHPTRPIIVEVTEHAIIDDYSRLDLVRAALRARGIRLAVDDAGAGFASLRHIVRLAPDIIKLDTALTHGVQHDPVRRCLADCLIRFAEQTGSTLLAEGLEEDADLAIWMQLGAHAAQGYLLARPDTAPCTQPAQPILDRLNRPGSAPPVAVSA